jgi:hypothetical protein
MDVISVGIRREAKVRGAGMTKINRRGREGRKKNDEECDLDESEQEQTRAASRTYDILHEDKLLSV